MCSNTEHDGKMSTAEDAHATSPPRAVVAVDSTEAGAERKGALQRLPTDQRIRTRITGAVHNALAARRRIKALLWYGFGYGTAFLTVPTIVYRLVSPAATNQSTAYWHLNGIVTTFTASTLALAGVAILPTDDRGIARVCIGALGVYCWFWATLTNAAISAFSSENRLNMTTSGAVCCWMWSISFAVMIYFQWQTLRVTKSSRAGCCTSCCKKGSTQPEYRMAPRQQLQRCWSVFRYGTSANHFIPLMYVLIDESARRENVTDDWKDATDVKEFYTFFLHLTTWSIAPLLMTPRVRGIIYRWMMHRGLSEEESSLMIVAELVGEDADIEATIEHASAGFRCLPFESLQPHHLDSSLEIGNELYDLSIQVPINGCDAFVSQSWHDDGNAKYKALARWAAKFARENGRQPLIWLDKASIDQTMVHDQQALKQNLACLPVWLGGSQELLMLVGPTYLHRIWCALEVLVFVRMGRDDHITLLPLDQSGGEAAPTLSSPTPSAGAKQVADPSSPQLGERKSERKIDILAQSLTRLPSSASLDLLAVALERLSSFDVAKATCFLEADRQRLLAVVDAAYGSLDEFNAAVRSLFKPENARRFEWTSKSTHKAHKVTIELSA